jgi:SAM-dependent methyltransferase
MGTQFTAQDKRWIKETIWETYSKAAKGSKGLFNYPTGHEGLTALKYDPDLLQTLPPDVTASYCGVGNPFTLGPINQGDVVLDVGCGAGVDTLISGMRTGPSGKVVGIDLTPAMLQKANKNLSMTDLIHVRFEKGSVENLPFADEDFDVVTSNGALNLVPDKARAFAEIYRVLKSGGRLMVADEILIGELPKEKDKIIKSWAQ